MLSGRTVLITGGNRGIGRAIAECMASKGADLCVHARRETDEFVADMQHLADRYSVSIEPLFFELTDSAAMKEAINRSFPVGRRLDVLVNNAGVAHGGLFQMTTIDSVRDVFEVNFFAQLTLTQMVLRRMIRLRAGSVINMASIAGLDLHAGNIAYGASKAALIAATKTLAAEVGPLGVRVNAVAPGLTSTDMADLMEAKAGADMIHESAMKRPAQPGEVAEVVAFLASDAAAFVNGQVLRVDGGSS